MDLTSPFSLSLATIVGLSLLGVPVGGPAPVHTKISEAGPQGPVGPLDHQLPSPRASPGTPSPVQVSRAVWSGPSPLPPPKTVACSLSTGMPNPSVSRSKPHRRLVVMS